MNPTDKENRRLNLTVWLGSCLMLIVIGFGLIMVIIHAIHYFILFVQNPSATWGATWSHVIKGLRFHLGRLITYLTCFGLFIVGALWLFGPDRTISRLCCRLLRKSSEKDLSKFQECLFWVVHILAFFILVMFINWLYIYVAHFLRWLGLFAAESWSNF